MLEFSQFGLKAVTFSLKRNIISFFRINRFNVEKRLVLSPIMHSIVNVRGLTTSIIFAILFFFVNANSIRAQERQYDTLSADFQLGFLVTSESHFLPFYLVNNRFGEVDEDDNLFLSGSLKYERHLSNRLRFQSGFSYRNKVLSSHFLGLTYEKLYFNVGRYKRQFGGLKESLSSGSLALSQNARPIPSIEVGLLDYVDVPFTGGYFKTKGHISHGWLETDRFISNAVLHSKSFYLKLDLEKEIGWSAASGIVHFAQYGGVSPLGDRQPSSFSDFLRVFAGSGIPNPDGTTAGESNGLGNHLGIVETTVTQQVGEHGLTLNYQKPFEDFGSLQYISFTDYLIGLEWNLPESNRSINRVYVEYIQTKWQGGPGLPDATDFIQNEEDNFGYGFGGRDDNYNNFLYRSGWTYQGQVIGNPLFLTYERTLNFLEAYPDYGVSIVNNRFRALHLGLDGKIGERLSYKGQFTYTKNFGTYAGLYEGRFNWAGATSDPNFEYVFRPALEQIYSLIDLQYLSAVGKTSISFNLRLAYDFGDLYNNFGSEVSVTYLLN